MGRCFPSKLLSFSSASQGLLFTHSNCSQLSIQCPAHWEYFGIKLTGWWAGSWNSPSEPPALSHHISRSPLKTAHSHSLRDASSETRAGAMLADGPSPRQPVHPYKKTAFQLFKLETTRLSFWGAGRGFSSTWDPKGWRFC